MAQWEYQLAGGAGRRITAVASASVLVLGLAAILTAAVKWVFDRRRPKPKSFWQRLTDPFRRRPPKKTFVQRLTGLFNRDHPGFPRRALRGKTTKETDLWWETMGPVSDRPTALVTGANRGLGLETSIQLRAKGFRVIMTSRDEKKGAAAVRGLDPDGDDVLYHQLDITDQASISAVARDLPALVPRLDLLVNNAGIGSWGADRRASVRTIATNYFGSRDVTDALLPFIANGGRIVMVSSGLGELSYMARDFRPRFADPSLTRPTLDSLVNSYLADLEKGEAKGAGWPSAYSVSKVAMNALTRILARELAPRKIRINSVCPGWVRTDMGGPGANRSVEVGARSILLGAMLPEDVTGGFYRDGKKIPW